MMMDDANIRGFIIITNMRKTPHRGDQNQFVHCMKGIFLSFWHRKISVADRFRMMSFCRMVCIVVNMLCFMSESIASPWERIPGPSVLSPQYGLDVISLSEGNRSREVTAPSASNTSKQSSSNPMCPVHIRAIITAQPNSESFAIVADSGSSIVLHMGEKKRLRGGLVTVVGMGSDHINLRRGDALVTCRFSHRTMR